MAITVTTPASFTDLTTIAVMERELDLNDTSLHALLGDLIRQATFQIQKFTGRVFAHEVVTESLPGTGTPLLYVSRTPIRNLTQVTIDGDVVPATEYTIEDAEAGSILLHTDGTPPAPKVWPQSAHVTSGLSLFPLLGLGSNNVDIQYEGGYKMPGESGRDLPYDLERACLDLCKTFYLERGENPRIIEQAVGDSSERRGSSMGIPPHVLSRLAPWKRLPL